MTTALGDLKTRLRTLIRRPSTTRSSRPTIHGIDGADNSQISLAYPKSIGTPTVTPVDEDDVRTREEPTSASETQFMLPNQEPITNEPPHLPAIANLPPKLTLEEPTPDLSTQPTAGKRKGGAAVAAGNTEDPVEADGEEGITTPRSEPTPRTESTVPSSHCRAVTALVEPGRPQHQRERSDYFGANPDLVAIMSQRKIWVKRPGASATLVSVKEDDLVDDVRDMILRKYTNSLGKSFDAPDVTLRIMPRDQSQRHSHGERILGPEESIIRTLDGYYPGGQNVTEALIIDVPQRRTPRHSPRVHVPYYAAEDLRPAEHNTDYFSVLPVAGQLSPHLPSNHSTSGSHHAPHALSILNTGQVPPLPSPGSRTRYSHRPKYGRNHTQSPTAIMGPTGLPIPESLKTYPNGVSGPSPIPTPPALPETMTHRTETPPPRVSSPRPKTVAKKPKKGADTKLVPSGPLNGTVPPINVLIVEDNMINLRLLEAFMKRLKVRWQTAMDGREAVNKWRTGGFHLVLMDIQLPIMNGLEATKEIRRLERLNKIGVLSNTSSVAGTPTVTHQDGKEQNNDMPEGDDCLTNTGLFKSPVIIVALTASSLQSDRHEALAAGCNDFLTKPVNFVWLERKVMEWGCMQALIDFDGWRKWKDFSSRNDTAKSANAAMKVSPKSANGKMPGMGGSAGRREKRNNEMALGTISSGSGSESIDTEKEDGRRKVLEVGA